MDRLEHLDQQSLLDRGIKGVLLDRDNTLTAWGSREISPARREWIERAKTHFALCIVSNTVKGSRLKAIGAELGIPVVARWGLGRKPFGGGIRAALRLTGTTPEETVIVGDQVFADILGGNRLGLFTVWVPPLNHHEFLSTMCMRGLERMALKHLGCAIPTRSEPEHG